MSVPTLQTPEGLSPLGCDAGRAQGLLCGGRAGAHGGASAAGEGEKWWGVGGVGGLGSKGFMLFFVFEKFLSKCLQIVS